MENETPDVTSIGTESHSDADLRPTLGDGVRKNAVHADGREQEGYEPEQRQQERAESISRRNTR